MIAFNESDPTAAEVPFLLVINTTSMLTGHSFTLGEVQFHLPGGSWVSVPTAQIVEKGFGQYAVQLTAAQTVTPGNVEIRATVSGTQPYLGVETIGTGGGDFPVGSASGAIPFFLPNASDPIYGSPLTGHSFTSGEVQLCLPGGVYAAADPTLVTEIGNGAYQLSLTSAQTVRRGKAWIYVNVSGAQPFGGWATILTAAAVTVIISPPSAPSGPPVVNPLPASQVVDHVAAALARLPEQFK